MNVRACASNCIIYINFRYAQQLYIHGKPPGSVQSKRILSSSILSICVFSYKLLVRGIHCRCLTQALNFSSVANTEHLWPSRAKRASRRLCKLRLNPGNPCFKALGSKLTPVTDEAYQNRFLAIFQII